jgi:hypothetical protein
MDLQYVTPCPGPAGRVQPRRGPNPSNSAVIFRPPTPSNARAMVTQAACDRTSTGHTC